MVEFLAGEEKEKGEIIGGGVWRPSIYKSMATQGEAISDDGMERGSDLGRDRFMGARKSRDARKGTEHSSNEGGMRACRSLHVDNEATAITYWNRLQCEITMRAPFGGRTRLKETPLPGPMSTSTTCTYFLLRSSLTETGNGTSVPLGQICLRCRLSDGSRCNYILDTSTLGPAVVVVAFLARGKGNTKFCLASRPARWLLMRIGLSVSRKKFIKR